MANNENVEQRHYSYRAGGKILQDDCGYNDTKIGSGYCTRTCLFCRGHDEARCVVFCAHPRASCQHNWIDVTTHLDDEHIRRCAWCGKQETSPILVEPCEGRSL